MSKIKKKIIIIGPAYPYRGGNSVFVSYVYNSLKEFFDVKIYNYKLLYPSLLFPGTTQFDKSSVQMVKAPSERIVNSINPFNWIKTAKKINNEKADLVVFDWWHPFFGLCHFTISFLIKKNYGNKILFITENFVSHENNFFDKILTKIGLTNAAKFLALSNVVEKDLKDSGIQKKIYKSSLPIYKFTETKNEINFNHFKKEIGYDDSNKILLFFGYVRKYKGLDILLDAFPEMLKKFPELRLLIVGEFYTDPKVYFSQVKNLKIENEVKIINQFIPNEEVEKYYRISDLVALPYRSATQSAVLTIAYGFSKPVIVTNVGGLAEFVKNKITGLIVEPNSSSSLVKGVEEFFGLNEKIDFETNVKNYISQNEFEKLPELFLEILNDSK